MRYFNIFMAIVCVSAFLVTCKMKEKEMSLEDYSKIEMEATTTDMKSESIEVIVKKYGYSLKQYNDLSEKIQQDTTLQEKLGEIRLNEQKKGLPDK